jgi:tRNA dimethylallyltransferase
MVGGTGLYIKAFADGLDDIPIVEEAVRNSIRENYDAAGIAWLQSEVEKIDPLYFATGETKNPQRMMRALEVKMSTGQSILDFRTKEKKQRPFNIVKIGLELPRADLYQRINVRVDQMMDAGLLGEAESLLPYKHLNALQTVGYRELFDYFGGVTNLDRAVELIKQNSRHYAKRQLTWFKRDPDMKWIDVSDTTAVSNFILKHAGISKRP